MPKGQKTKKQKHSPARKIVKIALIVLAAIVGALLVFALIVWLNLRAGEAKDQRATEAQQKKYTAAEKACGEKPIVVIDSYGTYWGGHHSFTAYLPASNKYDSMKFSIKPSNDLGFGYDAVDGYYCTLEAAKDSYKDKDLFVDPAQ